MAQQLFELLKKDHRQVEQMMKQIDSADEDEREELFQGLKSALNEHLQIEERYYYPKLKSIQEMKELVSDALEEHKEAKDHLLELDEMEVDIPEWQKTFQKMREGLQHHIQDEEKKIFPKTTQVLSEQQLKDIAQQCLQEKQKGQPARPSARAGGRAGAKRQPRA